MLRVSHADLTKELQHLVQRAERADRERVRCTGVGGVYLVRCHRPPPGKAGPVAGHRATYILPSSHSSCGKLPK